VEKKGGGEMSERERFEHLLESPCKHHAQAILKRKTRKIVVQAVEHSTRWGEHTNVWARVDEQDITYKFYGRVNLEIGKTYRIVFVDRWAVFGFEVWGEVISVEEVKE